MKDWYKQAEIWSVYSNSKTREDFVKNWVIEGHFHAQVPEDVIDAYETAAYLMAHAWYHWPMFDEALRKVAGIFEMAVKLKCQQLEIPLKHINNRSGKEIDISLSVLVDQVASQEKEKNLKNWMQNVRKIRNRLMHPEKNSFAGGMVSPRIKGTVNLINLLFLENKTVIKAREQTTSMQQTYAGFKEGLYVLEYNNERMLIAEVEPMKAFKIKEEWVSLWLFRPVLTNTYETLSNHRYAVPPFLVLKQLDLKNGELTAITFEHSESIKLIPTEDPRNQALLDLHLEEWRQLEERDRIMYDNFIQREGSKAIHDFMYRYCWA